MTFSKWFHRRYWNRPPEKTISELRTAVAKQRVFLERAERDLWAAEGYHRQWEDSVAAWQSGRAAQRREQKSAKKR